MFYRFIVDEKANLSWSAGLHERSQVDVNKPNDVVVSNGVAVHERDFEGLVLDIIIVDLGQERDDNARRKRQIEDENFVFKIIVPLWAEGLAAGVRSVCL